MSALHRLAASYGVETTFEDGNQVERTTPPEALVKILRSLDVPLDGPEDAGGALQRRSDELAQPGPDGVAVAWNGNGGTIAWTLPAQHAVSGPTTVTGRLVPEGTDDPADAIEWQVPLADLKRHEEALPDGRTRTRVDVPLPDGLPLGLHVVQTALDDTRGQSLVISAPERAPPLGTGPAAGWGVFTPLYGLHSARGEPCGDLTTLDLLAARLADLGGNVIVTLPLLPTFLARQRNDPSPYAAISRRFWHELYIDPEVEPEHDAPAVQAIFRDPHYQGERARLGAEALVDHAAVAAWKRRVLSAMAHVLDASDGARRKAWRDWLDAHPDARAFARFRALAEVRDASWHAWEERTPEGLDAAADLEPDRVLLHEYAQWVAEQQVARVDRRAHERGIQLALDLPLGTHPDGYDAWRDRDAYAENVNVGAPPDGFFVHGQDWGFRPYHPDRLTAHGFAPLRAALAHHMRHARVLRIDHVMGLHRQYWVPHGHEATDGAYVHYDTDVTYALVLLEAHRQGCALVGEDLGTVPPYVRPRLQRHGLYGMHVAQLEVAFAGGMPPQPGAQTIASVNTHDMPPFAAFWTGQDIDERVERGLLSTEDAEAERRGRASMRSALRSYLDEPDAWRPPSAGAGTWRPAAEDADDAGQRGLAAPSRAATPTLDDAVVVLDDLMVFLASAPTPLVVANLEDLWGETAPQNRPGTTSGPHSANWRHRLGRPVESLVEDAAVRRILQRLDHARRRQHDRHRHTAEEATP